MPAKSEYVQAMEAVVAWTAPLMKRAASESVGTRSIDLARAGL